MSELDLIIRNAEVATATDVFVGDIGIANGKVAQLGTVTADARRIIDARGRLMTPGGVDGHCHLDQPSSDGSVMADDFATGTLSAAFGGTTTVLPFACQQKGNTLRAAIEDYHRRAHGKPVIDYGFHLIVSDPTPTVLGEELPALIREGYTHFKIYMTYDDLKVTDRQILDLLALARVEGAMPMIHAENDDCIAWLTDLLEEAGKTAPRFHAESRPTVIEREAAHRAISLAELIDVPVLIVHVSSHAAMSQIEQAQSRGIQIFAETCPQYLFLTADDLAAPGFEGAKCICSPPPRTRDDQEHIWRGLRTGVFQVFSSDHAPYSFEGTSGKRVAGASAKFRAVPNGVPGIETRMALLMSEGVMKGRIDIHKFVSLTATAPAKIYGLYPKKGSIVPGCDADLVIWNTERPFTLTNDRLHHNVDYTPYEGMQLSSWPDMVFSRGELIIENGECLGQRGRGQYLKSARRSAGRSAVA
ncbi:dihydropyrimidinase [Povalibacter sp.]|uniref:dihydropyrimidinase n=1 Tax=Povalibacter sp. TaxID=1962978 RepID=UPI002F419981